MFSPAGGGCGVFTLGYFRFIHLMLFGKVHFTRPNNGFERVVTPSLPKILLICFDWLSDDKAARRFRGYQSLCNQMGDF
jgi:hypothetical protein